MKSRVLRAYAELRGFARRIETLFNERAVTVRPHDGALDDVAAPKVGVWILTLF